MNKEIKIIHISKDLNGGIGTVIGSLCKKFTSSISLTLDSEQGYDKLQMLDNIIRYKNLKNKLLLLIGKFDVLHFHGAWTPHILLLTNKYNIPAVVSPHGAFHKASLQKSKIKKLIAKYIYMKRAYQNANCIHALTLQEAQDIRDYGIKNIPIAVIPNGIDLDEKININETLKTKLLKIANNRRVILSLSRLHLSKGIDILIDAFARLSKQNSNNVLFIVGSGDKDYEVRLMGKIEKLKMQNSIFLLGEMTNNDKNTVYDIADLFVLPSLNEGFGITVLEAYRQKVPVITTTATPFKEIEEIGCGWFVKPLADDLFLALEEFAKLTNQELELMGAKGYRWIRHNYSLDLVNKKVEDLYHWLVKGSKEPEFIIREKQ